MRRTTCLLLSFALLSASAAVADSPRIRQLPPAVAAESLVPTPTPDTFAHALPAPKIRRSAQAVSATAVATPTTPASPTEAVTPTAVSPTVVSPTAPAAVAASPSVPSSATAPAKPKKKKAKKKAAPKPSAAAAAKPVSPTQRSLVGVKGALADPTYTEPLGELRAPKKKAPKTLPVTPALWAEDNSMVASARVVVSTTVAPDKMRWDLSPLDVPVLTAKLAALNPDTCAKPAAPSKGAKYSGLTLHITSTKNEPYQPIRVYGNSVTLNNATCALQDTDRNFEYWVFSTARTFDQRVKATDVLNIFTFGECLRLGHVIVETTPRQCVLPDGTTFVEDTEKLTAADRKITDFDKCFAAGRPIIETFPRKCMAPGGRLYLEPPRVK
jgi:hypothetical protein